MQIFKGTVRITHGIWLTFMNIHEYSIDDGDMCYTVFARQSRKSRRCSDLGDFPNNFGTWMLNIYRSAVLAM